MSKYESIKLEKKQNALWIILNRPSKLNAINEALIAELSDALDSAEKDSSVRCVVITGAGDKAFSGGADLTMFSSVTPTKAEEIARMGQKTFTKIEELPKPVIAGINGFALGGGLELALACDIRVASENAELGCTEVTLGLIPGWGGTQRLVRIVGLAKTKEMVMLGIKLKADEALKIGLIHQVAYPKTLQNKITDLAESLCQKSPIALKYAKQVINFGSQVPLDIGLRLEATLFGLTASTNEFKEALEIFKSKNKANFKEK